MDKNKVKNFWRERSRLNNLPRVQSAVNFETDPARADDRRAAEIECIDRHLFISPEDTIIDLGAGNGQWSLHFAPRAKRVIAVEFMEDFVAKINELAAERGINNIDCVCSAAEDYIPGVRADIVFISGLFNYLTDAQFNKALDNLRGMVSPLGRLFLRETVSTLEDDYALDDVFSKALGTNYSSFYRTADHITEAIEKRGFVLREKGFFFDDSSAINKWSETRLMYFLFDGRG